ncbi:MAG: hypothetical protein CM1200mP16_10600 [Nitrospina sp.]|nr:MAG: hypothetical protein CM1200mP16_10600 [Nitrospina sp.]
MTIHPSAVIDPSAKLEKDVSVGPFSIIGCGVKIGAKTVIGSHVLIEANTIIGNACKIFQGASIGGEPQIINFEDVPSSVEIGNGTVVREYATIHRSMFNKGITRIGKNCLLMAYSHLGHDCKIGDQVVIVNGTGLSGHVTVEDQAFILVCRYSSIFSFWEREISMVGGMAG